MTPEVLLLTLVRSRNFPSYAVSGSSWRPNGFKLDDLENEAESLVKARVGHSADFDYVTGDNRHVDPVGRDAGRAGRGTHHRPVHERNLRRHGPCALAAMSQRGVSTAGLLQRHGVTLTVLSQHACRVGAFAGSLT